MRKSIVVGSRGSRLARVQTAAVVSRLRSLCPDMTVTTREIATGGDRNRRIALDHMSGIGVFVKELEEALLAREIDLAVHSLKDMPAEVPSGLSLAAVMERADPRDVLVTRGEKLAELAPGARIGTGSLRRAVQVNVRRPDLAVSGIRGNVDTRLRKVSTGEFAGVILAAAALQRLEMTERITEYLSADDFLPAVGQGALALEIRADDDDAAAIAASLNHLATWQAITGERAFLLTLGGGCRAPIAALGTVHGDRLKLAGMVADVPQRKMLRSSAEGAAADAEALGESLAREILGRGAADFILEARQS
ncbi:MAG: hydroxymethylbilane synthase [Chloroflexota bacterium]